MGDFSLNGKRLRRISLKPVSDKEKMKILVAAICMGLQVIYAQETTAPAAVTAEPPAAPSGCLSDEHRQRWENAMERYESLMQEWTTLWEEEKAKKEIDYSD